jgi:hypothetical protein
MNCFRKYRNKRSIETTKERSLEANVPAVTLDAWDMEMVPARLKAIIVVPVPWR